MFLVLDVIVLFTSWAIVWQQIAATRGHFVSEKVALPAIALGALVVVAAIVFSILLFMIKAPLPAVLVGLALEIASLLLFRATITSSRDARLLFAFDPGMPHGLLGSGPYRYVRHPFYTSYLMFWAGWALAVWSWFTLPFLVGFVVLYVGAAFGEERKFASTGLSSDYQNYRRRVGPFWPKLPSRTDNSSRQ